MHDPVPSTTPSATPPGLGKKSRAMVCFAAIALALGGLLVGFGQPAPGWKNPERTPAEPQPGALPAVRYLDMDGKARGPNRHYVSTLVTLQAPATGPNAVPAAAAIDPKLRAEAVARRAARRAYSGAPPVIPHVVDANDVTSCYQCHGEGKVIDTVIAPKISHQRYTNCTQCHAPVSVAVPGSDEGFQITNVFTGKLSAGKGSRAYIGAPPTVPHATLMRENCMACHGLLAQPGLKTPHPWRVNCLQCHAPDSRLDQRAGSEPAPPPWAGETLPVGPIPVK